MCPKLFLYIAATFLVLAYISEARHVSSSHRRNVQLDDDDSEEFVASVSPSRQTHPGRSVSHKQARVFPGAVAIKKLVLLKFKKIVPISLILLRSTNENEAELVPVYPTSEIPANVQFIPTPNGISGHKDVQAIAIPSELHEQLEASGLANIENIEALLNEASEVPSDEENTLNVVGAMNVDEPLNVNESDLGQILEGANAATAAESKPAKTPNTSATSLRRIIAPEDTSRPANLGLRAAQQTAVEEIPLFLYSAKDKPVLHQNARLSGLHLATSNSPARRFIRS